MKTKIKIKIVGRIIRANGRVELVEPKDGKKFSLDELQAVVGGYIELVRLSRGRDMWINEEGKLNELPINLAATKLWHEVYGPNDIIVGDVMVTGKGATE